MTIPNEQAFLDRLSGNIVTLREYLEPSTGLSKEDTQKVLNAFEPATNTLASGKTVKVKGMLVSDRQVIIENEDTGATYVFESNTIYTKSKVVTYAFYLVKYRPKYGQRTRVIS